MHFDPQSKSCKSDQWRISNSAFRSVMVLLLFAAAFGIRLFHIDRPPLDFAPIRQYQNAHIARGLYYETNDSISESRRNIAKLNMERMGFVLEPRIIEKAAVLGYRIVGAEYLWIPRVLSSIFWIIGGFFLYLTARMIFSPGTALFSTLFYLFLPYGILASRGIQPDPLMVMMTLVSIYMVLRYDEKRSRINLVTAGIIAAIAVFIKPYCIFIIFGAFFSLAVLRMGFCKAAFNVNTCIFTSIIILPTIVHYAYGLLTDVGLLREHAKGSFLPNLFIYPPFWSGWLVMIGKVVGYIAFFLAIIGLLKTEKGRPRALLLGLWIGYFLFGLSATYQIHTHSYYHMLFIPIVALCLGPVAAIVINRRIPLLSRRLNIFILTLVLLVIIPVLGLSMNKLPLRTILSDYKSDLKIVASFIGINPEFGKFLGDDFENELSIAREIGEHVEHSTNTLFLTHNFGRVLAYHGELAGLPWPTSRSLYGRKLRGMRVPNIKEDFTRKYIKVLYQGKFVKYTPDFFIITALDEFEKQTDLKDTLNSNFPILAQTDNYLIFDLRKMSE